MKRRQTITLATELLPRSPEAIAHVADQISCLVPGQILHLEEGWMLEALSPELARDLAGEGLLEVGREYVRLDSYCRDEFRAVNLSLARALAGSLPGCKSGAPQAPADEVLETHSDRAGLCLNHRDALARLAKSLAEDRPEHLKALMPALTPAGIGGFGDRGARALSMELIRSACRVAGVESVREGEPRGSKRFGKRVQSQSIDSSGLEVRWSRSGGLSWKPSSLREAFGLLSLEIQGDAGKPSDPKAAFGFQPGHPETPRLFEVAHMLPLLRASDAERELLRFYRELKLPVDPEEPRGRLCRVAWELDVSVSRKEPRLLVSLSLAGLPVGQRCRLRVPVPFHPRPSRVPVVEPDGSIGETEKEGAFAALPVRGAVALCCKEAALRVEGTGLSEVEVLAFRNDHVLAITLLRSEGEGSLRRDFVLGWEPETLHRAPVGSC